VADGPPAGSFTERQRTLLTVSDELLAQRALAEATWSAVQATLSDREAIESCLLIGHYQGLASTIGGLGIQIEQLPRPAELIWPRTACVRLVVPTHRGAIIHRWQAAV